jgi:hypothetical protein
MTNYSGFSRRLLPALRYFIFAPHHALPLHGGFPCRTGPSLAPGIPSPDRIPSPRPHSSVVIQCRNIYLLSIGYAFQPRLRPRLPQGRSALPWIPWIFGRMDSHHTLATHSGILSSQNSTARLRTASALWQCSPTGHNLPVTTPELRCRV